MVFLKSKQNPYICEGILLNSFYIKSKIIQKITFEFTLYICDFLNTARESEKLYAINHVVYLGLDVFQSLDNS